MSEQTSLTPMRIAVVGGTGKEGKGLAYRWARAGYPVVIGSRQPEKAAAAAQELGDLLREVPGAGSLVGMGNPEAVQDADVVVITVPYSAHAATLASLLPSLPPPGGPPKVVVDVTVPLVPPKVAKVQMPPAGSAAQEAQAILGEAAQVVAAFQNISFEHLMKEEAVECDVLVCGNGKAARTTALELVRAAGLTGWDAGPIENAVVVEGLTSVLIGLNKQFGVQSAGIRITGLPRND
jgi:NADPH-dependent F420 reductase